MKYNINKEFGVYRYMHTPVMPEAVAGFMGRMMRAPGWIKKDSAVNVTSHKILGGGGDEIEVLIFSPKKLKDEKAPALVYYHGGGFFYGAADYHYRLAKKYSLGAWCKVIFVQYRLAPEYKFPIPAEDCYESYKWALDNASSLGIDENRIAAGGDSAGGCLAAAVTLMCRDRGIKSPLFQLLIYPAVDRRIDSPSNREFTDTPMWHSRLSEKAWAGYLPKGEIGNISYASPMEAEDFTGLPPAYVELAQYDCLHDEGMAYGNALRNAGTEVELHETFGTMHGFDIAEKTPTVRRMTEKRIEYMARQFEEKE